MKKSLQCWALVLGLFLFLSAPLKSQDTARILMIEHQKSHKQIILQLGKNLRYQIRGSEDFERGVISGFTDSTLSLAKGSKSFNVRFSDLARLRLIRSTGRIVVGSLFAAFGLIWVVGAIDAGDAIWLIPMVPSFIIAAVLLGPREFNLKRKWKIKTTQT